MNFVCPTANAMTLERQKYYYHLELLTDAGYVIALNDKGSVFRLTNKGHDFLDSIEDEGRFKKLTNYVMKAGGKFTLQIIEKKGIELLEQLY